MVQIVNVVASGALDVELDLEAVKDELSDVVNYNPEKYPGAYIRFNDAEPLITLYRTGKYIITGASSETEVQALRDRFLTLLSDHEIIPAPSDAWFKVQNCVCMAELDRTLNLSAIAIGLGLEAIEYEPEQFPGLVYRPSEHDCVLLIFSSGKVIITGASDIAAADAAFVALEAQVNTLL